MQRRRFLATTGAILTTGIAGCTDSLGAGGSDDSNGESMDGGGGGSSGGSMDDTTTTSGGTPLADHAAGVDLDAQPVLGDLDTGNVVIAFEDPSCPRCRAFESGTVPTILSDIVEPGKGAFVSRNYPVIYPWGKPATQALEATFARSDDAFWALNKYYYANQSSFDTDNVLSKTAAFLTENTEVDGDAVASDAEAKTYDAAVQADLAAGEAAGVGRTTPTIFLFKDGHYVTKASGSISFEVIAAALGV